MSDSPIRSDTEYTRNKIRIDRPTALSDFVYTSRGQTSQHRRRVYVVFVCVCVCSSACVLFSSGTAPRALSRQSHAKSRTATTAFSVHSHAAPLLATTYYKHTSSIDNTHTPTNWSSRFRVFLWSLMLSSSTARENHCDPTFHPPA